MFRPAPPTRSDTHVVFVPLLPLSAERNRSSLPRSPLTCALLLLLLLFAALVPPHFLFHHVRTRRPRWTSFLKTSGSADETKGTSMEYLLYYSPIWRAFDILKESFKDFCLKESLKKTRVCLRDREFYKGRILLFKIHSFRGNISCIVVLFYVERITERKNNAPHIFTTVKKVRIHPPALSFSPGNFSIKIFPTRSLFCLSNVWLKKILIFAVNDTRLSTGTKRGTRVLQGTRNALQFY